TTTADAFAGIDPRPATFTLTVLPAGTWPPAAWLPSIVDAPGRVSSRRIGLIVTRAAPTTAFDRVDHGDRPAELNAATRYLAVAPAGGAASVRLVAVDPVPATTVDQVSPLSSERWIRYCVTLAPPLSPGAVHDTRTDAPPLAVVAAAPRRWGRSRHQRDHQPSRAGAERDRRCRRHRRPDTRHRCSACHPDPTRPTGRSPSTSHWRCRAQH